MFHNFDIMLHLQDLGENNSLLVCYEHSGIFGGIFGKLLLIPNITAPQFDGLTLRLTKPIWPSINIVHIVISAHSRLKDKNGVKRGEKVAIPYNRNPSTSRNDMECQRNSGMVWNGGR